MNILEKFDIDMTILKDIDIDIDKDILENIEINKNILENINIDIGISENIDIDINKDILSKISIIFQHKVELFHVCYDEIVIQTVNISTSFEISMKYQHVFLKISIST